MSSYKRSIVKSLTWRVVAVIVTSLLVFIITGDPTFAMKIGVVDTVVKLLLFFDHERVWDNISYGRVKQ